jgi:hypothetical protein
MKEGKLSSALMKRYGISKKDAVGKVLWHSLNEQGEIGVYDVKFGNTIVRNLTESDLTEKKKKKLHEHAAQHEDGPERTQNK